MKNYATIDEYISAFPESTQEILEKFRITVKKAAPAAIEAVKYGMPTLILNGNLIHFGAFKNHIGFYPASSGVIAFQKELSYQCSKGAIQFPINKPIPFNLVAKIVKFRIKDSEEKAMRKAQKKSGQTHNI